MHFHRARAGAGELGRSCSKSGHDIESLRIEREVQGLGLLRPMLE